jgi:hypothetical protein
MNSVAHADPVTGVTCNPPAIFRRRFTLELG